MLKCIITPLVNDPMDVIVWHDLLVNVCVCVSHPHGKIDRLTDLNFAMLVKWMII